MKYVAFKPIVWLGKWAVLPEAHCWRGWVPGSRPQAASVRGWPGVVAAAVVGWGGCGAGAAAGCHRGVVGRLQGISNIYSSKTNYVDEMHQKL